MAVDVGSAVGYLDLDISGFLAGLSSAQREADSASGKIASTLGSKISGVGTTLTSVGTTLTKKVSVPLLAVGAAGIKVAMNFEKGMSEVKAISGATGDEFDALREKAIDLGAETAFSASEVAAAMTEMAKAGWNSQQIIDGMGGVLDAAAASGEGLSTVSTIVADAITGFGLEAKESTRVADLLTQAANTGTIGITDLGETFKYIAPVAGAMGLSIEDVTTAIAAMSKSGIKGSQAGTSLRTMLTRMIKPTDDVAVAMDELGISLTNQDGSFKSLDDIIGEMRGSFEGLTDEQKTYYATVLAGQEGMSGMLSLLNLSQEEYDEIAESMDNSTGAAAATASVMRDNLSSSVEELLGKLESLAIKLGDIILPYLEKFVNWLIQLVDKFAALSPETQENILKFGGLAIAAGPVITAAGKLTTGIGNLVSAFSRTSGAVGSTKGGGAAGAIAGLFSALSKLPPIVWIIIAIIAVLTAAFITLWKTSEEFRDKVKAIWDEVKKKFQEVGNEIVSKINSLGYNFESFGELMKTIWLAISNFLEPVIMNALKDAELAIETVLDIILGIVSLFVSIFKGDWQGAWDAIKGIFVSIWDSMVGLVENNLAAWKGMLDVFLGWCGTTWENVWGSIKEFFINIWNSIISFFVIIWKAITTSVTTALETIKTTISTAWNTVKSFFTTTWTSIKNSIVGTWNDIKTKATTIWEKVKSAIVTPITNAKDAISGIIEKIKGFFDFEFKWPHIPRPKLSLSPSGWKIGDIFKGSFPKLNITWYKKAMNNGMILDSATIFGFNPKTGKFLGGGEAGSETIVGTNNLLSMIRQAVREAVGPLVAISRELARTSAELGYVTYNGFTKFKEYREQQDKVNRDYVGGDTFNFYSPKAIDEIEAAKQLKKTKRELAEGF